MIVVYVAKLRLAWLFKLLNLARDFLGVLENFIFFCELFDLEVFDSMLMLDDSLNSFEVED